VLAGCVSACSLQDFDALSSGESGLGASGSGTGGSAGRGGTSGASAGGNPAGGDGGTAPGAGSGGSGSGGDGNGGAPNGGSGGGNAGGTAGTQTLPDGGARLNVLSDPGFEGGHVGWIRFGNADILDVDGEGRDGSRCIHVVNRTVSFEGPASPPLESLLEAGLRYRAEAWVRIEAGSDTVGISLKSVCTETGEDYLQLTTSPVDDTDWSFLAGEFTVPAAAECTLTELRFYIEGPDAGISFYVDDVGLYLVE
jgi:hypothetical protein